MKKIISLLLVLAMVLCFAACGNDQGNGNTTEPSDTTPVPSSDPVVEEGSEPADNDVVVMNHDEFDLAELESQIVIETYVQAVESWWDGACHIYAQSEDGGYYIYQYACTEDEAAALVPGTHIRVTGYKTAWSGEVEIIDSTIEILEGSYIVSEPIDATALLGTDELMDHMNALVGFKGLTVVASNDDGAAFLYKWDGSGSQGDDLYFKVTDGTNEYTFTINVYMAGTGVDSDVYQAVEALNVGDVIDVQGFLYWYEGPQPHVTAVTPAV